MFMEKVRFWGVVTKTLGASAGVLGRVAVGRLDQDAASGCIWRWSQRLVDHADMRLHVHGMEGIDPGGSYIVLSNHRSYYDIPALFTGLEPIPLRMVAKAELFRVPLWGAAMRKAGIVPIRRGDRATAIKDLEAARDRLAGGLSVWMAPEGTRTRDGKLRPFKKGGFRLALDTDARILPVGVFGSERVVPVDTRLVHRGQDVTVEVGSPIDVTPYRDGEKGIEDLMQAVRAQMEDLVAKAERRLRVIDAARGRASK